MVSVLETRLIRTSDLPERTKDCTLRYVKELLSTAFISYLNVDNSAIIKSCHSLSKKNIVWKI
jgi:hypothetical protein